MLPLNDRRTGICHRQFPDEIRHRAKMILNMISTSVMIQLGRVKGNKMVNMQLSNQKLVERGTRMIMEELGLDHDHAQKLLLLHGSVKKVIDANSQSFHRNTKSN